MAVCPSPPFDQAGFVVSFDLEETIALRTFFETFGFVIIRDVLNEEEVEKTMSEFHSSYQQLEDLSFREEGPDLCSITQLMNRQNSKVHKAFTTIFNTSELIVDHDRLGVMRPTGTETNSARQEWRSKLNWLHLDVNPISGQAAITGYKTNDKIIPIDFETKLFTQGLIALTTAMSENDGGFHCVPGSHKFSRKWTQKHSEARTRAGVLVPWNDTLHRHVHKISLRKGSLLVWNSLLFHGSFPNHSKNWRIVQYVRMMPVSYKKYYEPLITDAKLYPVGFEMTDLGRCLFGLETHPKKSISIIDIVVGLGLIGTTIGLITWLSKQRVII